MAALEMEDRLYLGLHRRRDAPLPHSDARVLPGVDVQRLHGHIHPSADLLRGNASDLAPASGCQPIHHRPGPHRVAVGVEAGARWSRSEYL